MNSQHTAIHIAKSLNANRTSPNLSISMSLPTLKEKLTKFEKLREIRNHWAQQKI